MGHKSAEPINQGLVKLKISIYIDSAKLVRKDCLVAVAKYRNKSIDTRLEEEESAYLSGFTSGSAIVSKRISSRISFQESIKFPHSQKSQN